jgi:hypothetical protein
MEKAEEVKKQVKEILSYCLTKDNTIKRRNDLDEYKQQCMRQFPNFHMNYPTLFFSMIENPSTFPMYRLEEMLSLKNKIEKNSQCSNSHNFLYYLLKLLILFLKFIKFNSLKLKIKFFKIFLYRLHD